MSDHKTKRPGLRVRQNYRPAGEAAVPDLITLARGGNGTKLVEIAGELCARGDLRWEDVDMRALFGATIDVECDVRVWIEGLGERTITTSAFPVLAGLLTAELLERDDEEQEQVWQDLVTVRDTTKDTVHLIRIVNSDPSHIGGNKQHIEGDPYPLMATGEERVQVDTVHDGRRIAIGAKMLEVNDKAGFMEQVVALREWAMNRRDVTTLLRVYDVYGSGGTPAAPYVYRPNGTGTALYTTSTTAHDRAKSGTQITDNPFVDGESLKAAIDILANMRDANGYRVGALRQLDLVAPHALKSKVLALLASEFVPGVENERNVYATNGGHYTIMPHFSSKIDDFTTTDWLLGRGIKRQFQMVTRLAMEFISMAASMSDFLRTRLAFEARIADEFEIGAKDHNRVVRSLATTTAPSGPALGS